MVAEEFFVIITIFYPITEVKKGYFQGMYLLKLSGAGAGAGAGRNIFGSATLVQSQHFRPQWNIG
jgi:hypothetical protein